VHVPRTWTGSSTPSRAAQLEFDLNLNVCFIRARDNVHKQAAADLSRAAHLEYDLNLNVCFTRARATYVNRRQQSSRAAQLEFDLNLNVCFIRARDNVRGQAAAHHPGLLSWSLTLI